MLAIDNMSANILSFLHYYILQLIVFNRVEPRISSLSSRMEASLGLYEHNIGIPLRCVVTQEINLVLTSKQISPQKTTALCKPL